MHSYYNFIKCRSSIHHIEQTLSMLGLRYPYMIQQGYSNSTRLRYLYCCYIKVDTPLSRLKSSPLQVIQRISNISSYQQFVGNTCITIIILLEYFSCYVPDNTWAPPGITTPSAWAMYDYNAACNTSPLSPTQLHLSKLLHYTRWNC